MSNRSEGPTGHVPLKNISGEGLLRAVEAEAEALRIIHVRIQKQLQNLEVEEKLLQHMIKRTRSRHTDQELQDFDQQVATQQALQQQQQQVHAACEQPGQQQGQQEGGSKVQELLTQHPLLGKHRQYMGGFRRPAGQLAAGQQQQQQDQQLSQQQEQREDEQQQQLQQQQPYHHRQEHEQEHSQQQQQHLQPEG